MRSSETRNHCLKCLPARVKTFIFVIAIATMLLLFFIDQSHRALINNNIDVSRVNLHKHKIMVHVPQSYGVSSAGDNYDERSKSDNKGKKESSNNLTDNASNPVIRNSGIKDRVFWNGKSLKAQEDQKKQPESHENEFILHKDNMKSADAIPEDTPMTTDHIAAFVVSGSTTSGFSEVTVDFQNATTTIPGYLTDSFMIVNSNDQAAQDLVVELQQTNDEIQKKPPNEMSGSSAINHADSNNRRKQLKQIQRDSNSNEEQSKYFDSLKDNLNKRRTKSNQEAKGSKEGKIVQKILVNEKANSNPRETKSTVKKALLKLQLPSSENGNIQNDGFNKLVPATGNKVAANRDPSIRMSDTNKENELRQRKKVFQNYCRIKQVPSLVPGDKVKLKYSEKYNIAVRFIPKIGSTFFIQMFSILINGVRIAETKFKMSRIKVHQTSDRGATFNTKSLNKTLVMAAVRNPYSRLFAAYVDKIYLPNNHKLITSVHSFITRRKSSQGTKTFLSNILGPSRYSSAAFWQHFVSFGDFLSYAVRRRKGKFLLNHYDPCFPRLRKLLCNTDKFVIVKQESFSEDIEYILRKVHVDEKDAESYDVIVKSLEKSRAEVSVLGIIKTVLNKFRKGTKIWNRRVIVERLWHSFQIQGYIDKTSQFPAELFSSDSDVTKSHVIKVILDELKKNPLTSSQRSNQRKEMMLEAYKHVGSNLIKEIQTVYADDFSAFQYDLIL